MQSTIRNIAYAHIFTIRDYKLLSSTITIFKKHVQIIPLELVVMITWFKKST